MFSTRAPRRDARSLLRFISKPLLILSLLCISGLVPAFAQTIISSDFEDGTVQGWGVFGSGTVSNSTDVAHGGTHSLLITGRTANFNGPSISVLGTVSKGATYQVTAWVRLATGTPATQINITAFRNLASGANFDSIASSGSTGATDSAWTQLTGLYAFSGDDPTALIFYIECANGTASYYVDDVSVVKIADPPGPPPNTTGFSSNFDDGTTQGWKPRIGDETLTVTSADSHSAPNSLLTTGRTAAFRGPAFDVTNLMFNGSRYKISMWVKLAPGEPDTQLRVSLQRDAGTITTFHTVIGNTLVTAGAWVRLTTTYDVALANSRLTLYVEGNNGNLPNGTPSPGTASFYLDDVQVTFVPPPVIEQNIQNVKDVYKDFFLVGAGGVGQLEISGVHGDLLKKHFNSITSGNDMKWDATEPTEGTFRFTNADAQLSFAQANGIQMRGHTLLWHNQIPAWVFTDPTTGQAMVPNDANKALLIQRLKNHIMGVAGHFAGKLYAWDVVNEVIDENQPDCLRRSPWYNIIGPQYLDIAFQTARQVDPNALLFINEFNSTFNPKRDCYFKIVQDLKTRGIPVDGVGHQLHDNFEFPPVQTLIDTVNKFATLGVTQHVTEMDVNIYSGSANTSIANYDEIPLDRHIKVAYHYRDYFNALKQLAGKVTSVSLWGLADDNTWLNQSGRINAPLLFDPQLLHKLAYTAIIDPLDLPGADLAVTTTANPNPVLSGGNISYTITVTNNGHDAASSVALTDTLPSGTVFQSLTAPSSWTCTTPAVGSSGQVQCTIGSLDNGATAQFVLVANVACATANGTQIVDTASVTSTTLDPNVAPNNTASVAVTVSNPPPSIDHFFLNRYILFPPNRRLEDVALFYRVSDNCDAGITPVVTVKSNEPVTAFGDRTSPDWIVVNPHLVKLRAENNRFDRGPGIYTITVTATDSAGSSTSESQKVFVFF
jgi:endo-1,4-beta-xylanase